MWESGDWALMSSRLMDRMSSLSPMFARPESEPPDWGCCCCDEGADGDGTGGRGCVVAGGRLAEPPQARLAASARVPKAPHTRERIRILKMFTALPPQLAHAAYLMWRVSSLRPSATDILSTRHLVK